MRLSGKVVLVTGAGAGIGRAATLMMAKEGARVVGVGLTPERVNACIKEVEAAGGEGLALVADVAQEQDVDRVVGETVRRFGRIDVLVNNAGIYHKAAVQSTSLADWQRVLQVNLTGAFLCAKRCIQEMLRTGSGGVIVNVSSEAGLVGIPGQVAYNVSKAGMIALTRSLAVELAPYGIRVNCVCPGTTWTPLVEQAISKESDPVAARKALEEARPLNRLGRPEEIAASIVHLAADESAYATGAVLAVDGGYTAR
ncbi:MAG: SDR family oxidoreductase [Firmicutes bacterium]|nr:SDR family oxidoreductase [Bacillota bacterium]